jgi:hypothetical protein
MLSGKAAQQRRSPKRTRGTCAFNHGDVAECGRALALFVGAAPRVQLFTNCQSRRNTCTYGRGAGVGRGRLDLGVGVGRGVEVGVAVAVAVGVGVGVGVAPPLGAWITTIIGEPVLKKPTVALVPCGG